MASPSLFAPAALAALVLLSACAQVNVAPGYAAVSRAIEEPVATQEEPNAADDLPGLPPALASSIVIVEPMRPVVQAPPPPLLPLPVLIVRPGPEVPGGWLPVTQ